MNCTPCLGAPDFLQSSVEGLHVIIVCGALQVLCLFLPQGGFHFPCVPLQVSAGFLVRGGGGPDASSL